MPRQEALREHLTSIQTAMCNLRLPISISTNTVTPPSPSPRAGLFNSNKMCLWSRRNTNRIPMVPRIARAQSNTPRATSEADMCDSIILDEVPEGDIARILSIISPDPAPNAPASPTPSSDIFPCPPTDADGDKPPERCPSPASLTLTFGPGSRLCKFCSYICIGVCSIKLKQPPQQWHAILIHFQNMQYPITRATTTTYGAERF